jgi:hypothetical protein
MMNQLDNKRTNQMATVHAEASRHFAISLDEYIHTLNTTGVVNGIKQMNEIIEKSQEVKSNMVLLNNPSKLRATLIMLHNYTAMSIIFNESDFYYLTVEKHVEKYKLIQKEGIELFGRKNRDYGDAFGNYGVVGVLVRMGDKISRIQSITKNKTNVVGDESLRDTLIDLFNYSAMAIMLLDEEDLSITSF